MAGYPPSGDGGVSLATLTSSARQLALILPPVRSPSWVLVELFPNRAKRSARPTVCPCGAPIGQAATGRPRWFCCRWCRRRAYEARALIDRRRSWIADWRDLAEAGLVDPVDADRAIAECEADIADAWARIEPRQ